MIMLTLENCLSILTQKNVNKFILESRNASVHFYRLFGCSVLDEMWLVQIIVYDSI